jgi:protein-S-isoprenylcysteine O-methyltransferase Ste14
MPTQRLVVSGLYAYVRNPMYASVLALILGQALLFANAALIAYAVFFFICATIFVVYFEEQRLEYAFAEDWPAYSANVGRWLPRLKPWKPDAAKQETVT